nr:hypothetical protein GCM10020063_005190 [Dactylosporangium thailandense]
MTSFPAAALRVRDGDLPAPRRLRALRECALHCAPYGFRATWHHLVAAARIPRTLEADPASLVRAVDELARAREVVLPRVYAYDADRRRAEALGRRVPAAPRRPVHALAYCPDPAHHPTEPLPVVVRRVLDAYAAGVDAAAVCVACGTPRPRPGRAWAVCGVHPGGPGARPGPGGAGAADQWRRIWRRELPGR